MPTDWDLLDEFVQENSSTAFEALVERYAKLVYSSALRQTNNAHLAEDVSQAVFLLLARKAEGLSRKTVIAGWLFNTTHYAALKAVRSEARRRHYEEQAVDLIVDTAQDESWKEIAPILDEGIAALGEKDQAALLLRYYQERNVKEVGQFFGIEEETAKKRILRAVHKLRSYFGRRGYEIPGRVLVCFLAYRLADAKTPASLPQKIASALPTGGEVASSISIGSLMSCTEKALTLARFRMSFVRIGVLAVVLLGSYALWSIVSHESSTKTVILVRDRASSVVSEKDSSKPFLGSPGRTQMPDSMTLKVLNSQESPVAGAKVLVHYWELGITETHQSGTDGLCTIGTPASIRGFSITVLANGYAGKVVQWASQEIEKLPSNYTLRLESAISIRGRVEDEAGRSIAGARFKLSPWVEPSQSIFHLERTGYDSEMAQFVSDTDGRWECSWVPRQGAVPVLVTHPDFATSKITLAAWKDGNTDLRVLLNRGTKVHGIVTTRDGAPVARASIRERHTRFDEKLETVADSDGQFGFPHASAGPKTFVVQAPGFASKLVTIQSGGDPLECRFELEGSKVLYGRIVNEAGVPCSDVSVATAFQEGGIDYYSWKTTTDVRGYFSWDGAPLGPCTFRIAAKDYKSEDKLELIADGTEHLITLKPIPIEQFSGTVLDDESDARVSTFRVFALAPPFIPKELAAATVRGTNGYFVLRWESHYANPFAIRVEAEGYEPAISEPKAENRLPGIQRLEFRLKKNREG